MSRHMKEHLTILCFNARGLQKIPLHTSLGYRKYRPAMGYLNLPPDIASLIIFLVLSEQAQQHQTRTKAFILQRSLS
jgi:hypothetical protein